MRRDWPLVAAGFGVAAIGGTIVACMLLGYALEPGTVPAQCEPPPPPEALVDGCGFTRVSLGEWVQQPLLIAGFGFAFVLLLIAAVTIRRGLRRRNQRA
jgi:hypothetical protein